MWVMTSSERLWWPRRGYPISWPADPSLGRHVFQFKKTVELLPTSSMLHRIRGIPPVRLRPP